MISTSRTPGRDGGTPRWEYCLMTCTPMSGLDGGNQVRCRIIGPGAEEDGDAVRILETGASSPQVAIVQLLNEQGQLGWELVSYDLTTHRAMFRRRVVKAGGEHDP